MINNKVVTERITEAQTDKNISEMCSCSIRKKMKFMATFIMSLICSTYNIFLIILLLICCLMRNVALTRINGGPKQTPISDTMQGWFKPYITRASRRNSYNPNKHIGQLVCPIKNKKELTFIKYDNIKEADPEIFQRNVF